MTVQTIPFARFESAATPLASLSADAVRAGLVPLTRGHAVVSWLERLQADPQRATEAVRILSAAVALDPRLAPRLEAWARHLQDAATAARAYLLLASLQTDPVRCDRHLEVAVHHADTLADAGLQADVYATAAHGFLMRCGDIDRAERYARLALTRGRVVQAEDAVRRAFATMAWIALLEGTVERLQSAAARNDLADDPRLAAPARAMLGLASEMAGSRMEGAAWMRLAEEAWQSDDPETEGTLAAIEGLRFAVLGRRPDALSSLEHARQCWQQAGSVPFLAAWVDLTMAGLHLDQIEAGEPGRRLAVRRTRLRRNSPWLDAAATRLAARQAALDGRREQAMRRFAEALDQFDLTSPLEAARTHVQRGRWRIRWGLGRGRDDLRMAVDLMRDLGALAEEVQVVRLLGAPEL